MLSIFPIHFLSLFAFFILRVTIGFILLYLGLIHWKNRQELRDVLKLSWWPYGSFSTYIFSISEVVLGVMIIIGEATQAATLVVALMSLKLIILNKNFQHKTIPNRLFYLILFSAAISITITGAGVFAFDLPL